MKEGDTMMMGVDMDVDVNVMRKRLWLYSQPGGDGLHDMNGVGFANLSFLISMRILHCGCYEFSREGKRWPML